MYKLIGCSAPCPIPRFAFLTMLLKILETVVRHALRIPTAPIMGYTRAAASALERKSIARLRPAPAPPHAKTTTLASWDSAR